MKKAECTDQSQNWAKQLDLNWAEIRAEVLSGDYENAVKTMQKHFGHVAEFNGDDAASQEME